MPINQNKIKSKNINAFLKTQHLYYTLHLLRYSYVSSITRRLTRGGMTLDMNLECYLNYHRKSNTLRIYYFFL